MKNLSVQEKKDLDNSALVLLFKKILLKLKTFFYSK